MKCGLHEPHVQNIKQKEESDVVHALNVQRLIAQSQIQVLLGKLEKLVRLDDGAQLIGLLLTADEAGTALHTWGCLDFWPLN